LFEVIETWSFLFRNYYFINNKGKFCKKVLDSN